ncbi:hypothetical protein ACFQI7_23300 [Paenibacillus allorhizosphaerae]|uniref:Pilus assembly protein n=1 Tax=Paenibacillus allorhizosphaerae TaxID=2849866 RepID=A0ABM8VJV8_9BACL|nr:hypothetical protein [Paenibacillus allorhizosphaerae]CAG7646111.1 hypothetical protein PAECIP111802_03661 [Paenibacillus allorhizosphaerae]
MNSAIAFLREERGIANVLVTLYVMPVMLFLSLAIVPFFVYSMKADHLNTLANHALKEAEAIGYVSPSVMAATNSRLAQLGMGGVVVGGTTYPSYSGSTGVKVFRNSADPTIKLVLKYPAPNLTRILNAIGGSGTASTNEGFYYLVLYGKSEAYE